MTAGRPAWTGSVRDGFADWVRRFAADARTRAVHGDPDWTVGATLSPALVCSIQRFQVGKSGDGTSLIRKAERAGDSDYLEAVRFFVAEEQNHARLLGRLLASAGAPTLAAHWSDTAFVRLRRALGLRLELMTLTVAEVVALTYYQALKDGTDDPLLIEVAGRILADEQRHVPFHIQRLRAAFVDESRPGRLVARLAWWMVLLGATAVVVLDHGAAVSELGIPRIRFYGEVCRTFGGVAHSVLDP
jgi:hypothetical protein